MPNPVINRRVPGVATSSAFAYDPEVLDWINRVISNGGAVSQSTKDAANTLMVSIKTVANLRAKLRRANIFAGTGFSAAQVPLIIDAGSSLDGVRIGSLSVTGSGSDFTYVETGSTGGLTPLTSQAYITTGFTAISGYASIDSSGFSVYAKDTTTQSGVPIGCANFGSANQGYMLIAYNGLNTAYGNTWSTEYSGTDATRKGFYTVSRTASNLSTLYRDGTSLGTTASPGGVLPSAAIGVFAEQLDTGSATQFYTKLLAGYFIHDGLSSGEVSSLATFFQTFQTALGRQV